MTVTPRRIVIHIGLPKASSTTLQASLSAMRPALGALGGDYPAIGGRGVKDQKPLRLALRAAGREAADARAAVTAALAACAQRGVHTVVLSGETLHAGEPARLRALIDESPFAGAPITAVAIVRDAATWLNSRYAFEALLFRRTERFHGFALRALRRGEADLWAAFGRWMAPPVDRFVAVPLAARADPRPVVPRVIEAMGLDPALAETPVAAHKTAADPRTVEAARRLAARGLKRADRASVRRAQRRLAAAAHARGWTGRFGGLDPDLARALARRSAGASERFALAAWGAPWDTVYAVPNPAAFHSNEWRSGDRAEDAAVQCVVDDVARALALRPPGVLGWVRGAARAPRAAPR